MEEQFKESWQNMVSKLTSWLDVIITNLPNLLLAIVVFLGAFWLSKKINQWLSRILHAQVNQPSLRNLISNMISIVIIGLGMLLALNLLNLDKALTSILAGAGVAGLAIGLALQGALSNTFSGIFLSVKEILNVGDFVETNGYIGVIDEINLRFVKLREPDNNYVVIPNKMIVENPFKNYGLTKLIRTTVECGVAYDSDLQQVQQIVQEAIESVFDQGNRKLEFYYQEFAGSSINFIVRFWVQATENMTLLQSKSLAIMAIKDAFDKQGIEIPFPIRTLHYPLCNSRSDATLNATNLV